MSLLNVLDQIDGDDFNEEQEAQMVNRKNAIGKMGNFAKKMAVSAVPLGALAVLTSAPAKAQSKQQDIDILNYALVLERLEKEFYDNGVAAMKDGRLPTDDMTVFKQIMKHEDDHVKFLESALGSKAGKKLKHDYTANGMFDPFNKNGTGKKKAYTQFKIIAQGFEDTGVRAYKGQAPRIKEMAYLKAALQIHSVEARHAAEVRRVRHKEGADKIQPWIIGAGKYAPKPIKGVYGKGSKYNVSEGNTTQAKIDITQFVSMKHASEAFDEPLGMKYVKTKILPPFIPALRS
jgi:rubrerythrin